MSGLEGMGGRLEVTSRMDSDRSWGRTRVLLPFSQRGGGVEIRGSSNTRVTVVFSLPFTVPKIPKQGSSSSSLSKSQV